MLCYYSKRVMSGLESHQNDVTQFLFERFRPLGSQENCTDSQWKEIHHTQGVSITLSLLV